MKKVEGSRKKSKVEEAKSKKRMESVSQQLLLFLRASFASSRSRCCVLVPPSSALLQRDSLTERGVAPSRSLRSLIAARETRAAAEKTKRPGHRIQKKRDDGRRAEHDLCDGAAARCSRARRRRHGAVSSNCAAAAAAAAQARRRGEHERRRRRSGMRDSTANRFRRTSPRTKRQRQQH